MLENATEACKEIGVDWSEPTGFGTPSDYTHLYVLEDTPTLHHVIVCTLCSCYPRPAARYVARVVSHDELPPPHRPLAAPGPRGVWPHPSESVEIRVEDSNQKCRFMVLPVRPEGTEGWTEEQLAEIVTRDCMIGVALPRPDRKVDIHPLQKARRPIGTPAPGEEVVK